MVEIGIGVLMFAAVVGVSVWLGEKDRKEEPKHACTNCSCHKKEEGNNE